MTTILEKYFEDIRPLIPVGRLLLFILAFCFCVLSHNEINGSIVSRLLRVRVADFFSSGSLATEALVADVLFGIFFVAISCALFHFLSGKIISLILARLNFKNRMAEEYAKYVAELPVNEIRSAALDYARTEMERRLSLVKRLASLAELSFGLASLLILFSFYSVSLDAFFAAPLFCLAVMSESKSIIAYLRRVVPLEIHISVLLGLKPRFDILGI